MKASNFSALSQKPRINRPGLFSHGNIFNIRELSGLPCSCVDRIGMLPHRSLPSPKQYNLVVSGGLGRGTEVNLRLGRCCLNLQTGVPIPFRQASFPHSLKQCRVKSEDSEGALIGESIILYEQTLERALEVAIKEENYVQAAKIRDNLRLLQEDSKSLVLAANARFYNSFRNGDLAAMQALWSKGENVCVVHPGVSGISGYDLVMGSWEFVWADYEFPLQIEINNVQVHVKGDIGYVTCIEMVKTKGKSWGKQFATNVFERIDGQWFLCVHHASYIDL